MVRNEDAAFSGLPGLLWFHNIPCGFTIFFTSGNAIEKDKPARVDAQAMKDLAAELMEVARRNEELLNK